MNAETSNPDALVRIVGARCEKCDERWEADAFGGGVTLARDVADFWHVPAIMRDGYVGVTITARPGDCRGRVLVATEPYEARP